MSVDSDSSSRHRYSRSVEILPCTEELPLSTLLHLGQPVRQGTTPPAGLSSLIAALENALKMLWKAHQNVLY